MSVMRLYGYLWDERSYDKRTIVNVENTGMFFFGLCRLTCVFPCWPYTILVGMILVAADCEPELTPLGWVTIILVMGLEAVMMAGLVPWTACRPFSP